jgi:hypothetical protein
MDLAKRVGHTDRYYLTSFGKWIITTRLKLKNLGSHPKLALAPGRWTRVFCPI